MYVSRETSEINSCKSNLRKTWRALFSPSLLIFITRVIYTVVRSRTRFQSGRLKIEEFFFPSKSNIVVDEMAGYRDQTCR